jgi:hypothetical protein
MHGIGRPIKTTVYFQPKGQAGRQLGSDSRYGVSDVMEVTTCKCQFVY